VRFRGFIWAGLLVSDLEKAISFYRDVLGLSLIEREERCALFDAGSGALFELWPTGVASSIPKTPEQQSLRVAFLVDNLDHAISELKGRGVQFMGEIGEYEGTRWVNLVDPEGNRLELKESPSLSSQI
jgi:catechol 2,3-dioxygenase-like lactoylglutathione lyase family enzyme